MTDQDGPLFPEGIGTLLSAVLAPPEQAGPPYVHTYQQPEPELVLDDQGRPVLGDDGEAVMRVPIWPSYTLTFEFTPPEIDAAAEKRATANRRYWSGPDKLDRQILRAYRVKFRHLGLAPRSVLDGRYRLKQRARRRRK